MRRLHLFEWEDQVWLPDVIRDFITDHLRFTLNQGMRAPINVAMARRLKALIDETGRRQIVDLCAGAGGPLVEISRVLREDLDCDVDIVLTDLYPNVAAFERLEEESKGRLRSRLDSTSALDVPAALGGVRTVFTAFHHFTPAQARGILADAVRKRAPLAVFEPLERSVRLATLVGAMSLVRGWTHTPWVGRFTGARAFWTYVLPVAPIAFAWDGIVSTLRSYTPDELIGLTAGLDDGGYRWEAGRFVTPGPYGPMPTTYLIGRPGHG